MKLHNCSIRQRRKTAHGEAEQVVECPAQGDERQSQMPQQHTGRHAQQPHLRVSLAIAPLYFASTLPNEDVSGLQTCARSRVSLAPPTQPQKTVECLDRPEQ